MNFASLLLALFAITALSARAANPPAGASLQDLNEEAKARKARLNPPLFIREWNIPIKEMERLAALHPFPAKLHEKPADAHDPKNFMAGGGLTLEVGEFTMYSLASECLVVKWPQVKTDLFEAWWAEAKRVSAAKNGKGPSRTGLKKRK